MPGKKTVNNTTQQTQTNAPPSWTMPGMQELAGRITSLIPQMPGPAYQGDFIAPPNQTQYGALPLFADASQQALTNAGQLGQAAGQLQNPMSFGEWQTPRFDTSAAAMSASAPLLRQLTEQILPSMQSSALSSGAYGNSRMMEILPGMAIRDAMRGAQEIGTQMQFAEHQGAMANQLAGFGAMTERGMGTEGLRQQALSMLPAMLDAQMRSQTGAADIMAQSGSMQQAWDQSAIDNQLARHQYNIDQPFQGLDRAAQLLSGLAGNYGTQSMNANSKTVESTGGLAPWIGGAMGLAGLAAGMPGLGGALGLGGGAAAGKMASPAIASIWNAPMPTPMNPWAMGGAGGMSPWNPGYFGG